MKAAFDLCDSDGSGEINAKDLSTVPAQTPHRIPRSLLDQELHLVMRELGFKDSKEEVGKMIAQVRLFEKPFCATSALMPTLMPTPTPANASMQVDETGSGPLNFDKFRCVATNATAASHSKVIQHLGQVPSQGQQSHLLGCMVIRFGAQAHIMLIYALQRASQIHQT